MYKEENGLIEITCDKCGDMSPVPATDEGKYALFYDGWLMNSNGRKYKHLCRDCQTAKQRRAHDLVKGRFG